MRPGSGAWLAALCSSRVLSATWFVAYSAVLPLVQSAARILNEMATFDAAGVTDKR